MLRATLAAALAAILTWPGAAFAQQPRLFNDATEYQLVLEGPIGTLVRQASRNVDPYPMALTLADGTRLDVEVSARGMFRRVSGTCSFPPLRLNFQQEQVRGTLFRGQNRLKLVTRCRAGSDYERSLALEYLTYRMFNAITPHSFRVNPLRVTYRDSERRRQEETQFNFVIEDIDAVARRNAMVALDVESGAMSSSQLDPRSTAIVSVFEFMIGNLDWDYLNIAEGRSCCHNINHLAASRTSTTGIIPVPYDFDHSGFVDSPYATPPEGINIRSVRTRVYRGYCRHNDQLPAVLELFRQKRNDLYALIDNEQSLSDARRGQARRYIESFFEIADDPAQWNRQMAERCRGQPAGSRASAG